MGRHFAFQGFRKHAVEQLWKTQSWLLQVSDSEPLEFLSTNENIYIAATYATSIIPQNCLTTQKRSRCGYSPGWGALLPWGKPMADWRGGTGASGSGLVPGLGLHPQELVIYRDPKHVWFVGMVHHAWNQHCFCRSLSVCRAISIGSFIHMWRCLARMFLWCIRVEVALSNPMVSPTPPVFATEDCHCSTKWFTGKMQLSWIFPCSEILRIVGSFWGLSSSIVD